MKFRSTNKKAFIAGAFLILLGISPPAWSAGLQQTLEPERIIKEAQGYLQSHLPWDKDSYEVSVLYSGKPMELPVGELELDFQAPGKLLQPGRVPLALYVKVNQVVAKRVRLTALGTVNYELVKTVRRIARGEVIEPEDVTLERVKATRLPSRLATRLDDVLGYETRRELKVGRGIPMTSLKKPPLISKGARVTLVVSRGTLRITTAGKANEDGYRDNLVAVTNMQTRKTVYGRVVEANTVEVVF
jgi:flagella basal body P-ring formation protein FlgA